MSATFPSSSGEAKLGDLRNHKHSASQVSGSIPGSVIPDNSITSGMIANGAVSGAKIAPGAITLEKLHTSVRANIDQSCPPGIIIMWSGATVPSGWALCDGSNGRPDLRGRFVLGHGQGTNLTNRVVGSTGGAATVTLTVNQIPSHNHTFTTSNTGGHTHTFTVSSSGAHRHTSVTVNNSNHGHNFSRSFHHRWQDSRGSGARSSRAGVNTRNPGVATGGTHTHNLTVNNASHTHTLSTNNAGGHNHTVTCANSGSSQAHNNMPPFYVLAYIQKL